MCIHLSLLRLRYVKSARKATIFTVIPAKAEKNILSSKAAVTNTVIRVDTMALRNIFLTRSMSLIEDNQLHHVVRFMPAYIRITRYTRAMPRTSHLPLIDTLFISYHHFLLVGISYINIIILHNMIIIMMMIYPFRPKFPGAAKNSILIPA
jgi:hypothetical protein